MRGVDSVGLYCTFFFHQCSGLTVRLWKGRAKHSSISLLMTTKPYSSVVPSFSFFLLFCSLCKRIKNTDLQLRLCVPTATVLEKYLLWYCYYTHSRGVSSRELDDTTRTTHQGAAPSQMSSLLWGHSKIMSHFFQDF